SILTSSVTLISTSTNLVVSGLMTRFEMEPMGMFELAPVGVPIAIVGIAYMYFIGRRMIPDRTEARDLMADFGVRPYLSEIVILPKSPLIGKTLSEAGLGRDYDLTVVGVLRDKEKNLVPRSELELREGDVLMVHAVPDSLLKVKHATGIDIKADVKHPDPAGHSSEMRLVEVILPPKSALIGRTLRGYRFRERFGLQVLGLNRHGENIRGKLSQLPLRLGDVLLLQGPAANINTLQDDNTFRVLGMVGENRPARHRARRAILIFMGALALGSLKIVPFPVAVLLGSVGMFLSKCVTPEEAYREVEWKVVILIGCMLALGAAMEATGTAEYVAGKIVAVARDAGPVALLSGFFFLTIILTQPMSNQAAAVVVLPVAIETARQLGLNDRTFVMTVAVAASCSYLTPLEPSCLMVYGPGRYRFMDFLKVGSLLTILIYIIAILLIPRVWPLNKVGPKQADLPRGAPAAQIVPAN
ncbi:MAG TPA: SLC13 family permease, partial [Methylomirabilota bacterium]|nr:SLC13 family permease [Methylomirabilota bacterium]